MSTTETLIEEETLQVNHLQATLAAVERTLDERLRVTVSKPDRDSVLEHAERIAAGTDESIARMDEIARLRAQRHVLMEAIELRWAEIGKHRAHLSAEIAKQNKRAHDLIVKRLIGYLVALATVNEMEAQLRNRLKANGAESVDSHLTPMVFPPVGLISDINSQARMYLDDAMQRGYISAKEIEKQVSQVRNEIQKEIES